MITPMRSVTELRATIEGFAARVAAQRVQEDVSLQPLLDQFSRMKAAAQTADYDEFAACDQAFHQAIIEVADVPSLFEAWRTVFETQHPFRMETLQRCWPDLSMLHESHRPLVEAIASGNSQEAEEASIAHLDAIWFRLAVASDDPSLPRDPLSRACAYLAFHFSEPIRLTVVAREIAGCTAGHLARLFRDELDLSFSEYLIELRMQKGAQLLQNTSRAIQDVARRVGYQDPSRFTRHFRRRFGQTPGMFREKYKFNQRKTRSGYSAM
ncbi:FCD domain-containing protein [Blastopirellula sp. J2-11]|uniref:helix-turn-helix domain-containing protein n=1 Tax=Blastopirellula sp. J2-11 TaxID=2943192 RepID=UPI0021C9F67A|nr:helix-turn-helix domain-containing protein [Blastopirellula sp. J2-11]UUO06357.1 FCD domain-containing protein [Blastopirellula sp. J2-11]